MILTKINDVHTLPEGNYLGEIGERYTISEGAKVVAVKELFSLGLHIGKNYESVAEILQALDTYKKGQAKPSVEAHKVVEVPIITATPEPSVETSLEPSQEGTALVAEEEVPLGIETVPSQPKRKRS